MDQLEYITLIFGCGKEKVEHRIDMHTKDIDKWNVNRIKALGFKNNELSAVIVGPQTVFEFYKEDNFENQQGRVINNTTDKKRMYNFGCFKENPEIWRGFPGSFIIYTYSKFDNLFGTRYCSNDRECKVNEMCMCPNGQTHPSWCPGSKKRCRHQGYFWYELPIKLQNKDMIDMQCFNDQLKQIDTLGIDRRQLSDAVINDLKRRCAKEKLATIEPFGPTSVPVLSGTLFIILMIIFVLLPGSLFL